ncbi:hypothetical protein FOPE_10412 [Fonsecaea pedrosoi]|nr:hypothetical protein FOPE_10412 [Fonsecaea pedrosoi]
MLGECTKVSSIRQALTELPETLDETYERILNAIPRTNKVDARSILQWLVYSKRPLTLEEVADAAVLRPGDDPSDPDELCNLSEVLRICRSLVTLSTEKQTEKHFTRRGYLEVEVVRFAHFSVLEYLTSGRSAYFSVSATEAHNYIGECSISVLLQLDQPSQSNKDADARPVTEYAAQYWHKHVCEVEKVTGGLSKISDSAYRFLGETSPRCFLRWLQIFDPRDSIKEDIFRFFAPPRPTAYFPLFYSSLLGLKHATRRLIKSGADVNQQIPGYVSALHIAAEKGHYEIAQILLKSGADVNQQTPGYGSALHAAAKRGHYEIAQILLESGADANRWAKDYGTPLECGVANQHLSICQLLIDHGADVNAATTHGNGSVLLAALERLGPSTLHSVEIVQLLLTHGANVSARTARGWGGERTALDLASAKGFLGIVQLLLDKGADINAPGSLGIWTP